jgi:hypothetical protein
MDQPQFSASAAADDAEILNLIVRLNERCSEPKLLAAMNEAFVSNAATTQRERTSEERSYGIVKELVQCRTQLALDIARAEHKATSIAPKIEALRQQLGMSVAGQQQQQQRWSESLKRIHRAIAEEMVDVEQETEQVKREGIAYIRASVAEEFAPVLELLNLELQMLQDQERGLWSCTASIQRGYEQLRQDEQLLHRARSPLERKLLQAQPSSSGRVDVEATLNRLPSDEIRKYSQEIAAIFEAIGAHYPDR